MVEDEIVLGKSAPANYLNAKAKPLPESYPYETVLCCNNPECQQCRGKGEYYLYKRRKGGWLSDEPMTEVTGDLGAQPNW